jgi:hypothetical protein
VLYILLLVFLALTDQHHTVSRERLVCLAVVAAASVSVFVGMWCAETTRADLDAALRGGGMVNGVQGRYFIPFLLPFLLAISAGLRFDRRWQLVLASLTIFTVNAAALNAVHHTYYGSAGAYENKLVRRSGSAPEDGKIFLVRAGKRHWVVYGTWLVKHGYHYPQELITLTPQQFNTIPEGRTIGEP